jgi:hypothetical protein
MESQFIVVRAMRLSGFLFCHMTSSECTPTTRLSPEWRRNWDHAFDLQSKTVRKINLSLKGTITQPWVFCYSKGKMD